MSFIVVILKDSFGFGDRADGGRLMELVVMRMVVAVSRLWLC